MNNNNIKSLLGFGLAAYVFGLFIFLVLAIDHSLEPPPAAEAPVASVVRTVPNFAEFEQVGEKKAAFFGYFRPLIEQQNQRIRQQRAQLMAIKDDFANRRTLSAKQRRTLAELSQHYRVDATTTQQQLAALERRVNIIPPAMALAQAASESAWGTSRFAVDANNFFGQWCFKAGCGLVPSRRPEGASHEVAKFDSPQASVRSYFRNINTHPAYREFRDMRQRMAENDRDITGYRLVAGLEKYSERGEAYIEDLRSIISYNKLEP